MTYVSVPFVPVKIVRVTYRHVGRLKPVPYYPRKESLMRKFILVAVLALIGLCSFDVPESEARCGGSRGLFKGGRHPLKNLIQKVRDRRG